MKTNQLIKLVLFLVGLSLLFFLIYRVGPPEIVRVILKAKPHFIFLGILVYLLVILTRSFKWFLLVRIIENKISYGCFVPFYLVNSLMGNLTPFKSGEAVSPFLLKKYLKIPVGQGFSIVILDRFFELLIFTIILVLAIFYILNLGIQDSLILSVFRAALIILLLLLVSLFIVVISRNFTFKIVKLLKLKFLERELNVFYNTLPLFRNKKIYQLMAFLTLLSWFFEILAYYLVFSSISSVPFINIVVAQMIVAAATFATFIPGGVGVAEVGMVFLLGLLGYSAALITGGALLVRLFLTGTLLISGLIGSILIRERNVP